MRGSATWIILIAASILVLILMIAATHHPRTQVCLPALSPPSTRANDTIEQCIGQLVLRGVSACH